MVTGIQALPTEVVHLMAAGEVIDSLAAAVRELVENALDAGATRIAVSLWAEQWRVSVTDNGVGMTLVDLKRAAAPHSTSKIRTSDDLWKIRSLGFRGEALYSLAQLANLEILSYSTNTDEGWRVCYNTQGEAIAVETVAIAPGTVVTVANLFGNWLARRQGLPPPTQQMRAVQALIQQFALCHPQVTWQVQQNDREWFNLGAGETAQQILPQILREVRSNDLQQLTVEVVEPSEVGSRNLGGENGGSIPVQDCPHSPTPSPQKGEGKLDQSPSPGLREGFRVRATEVGYSQNVSEQLKDGALISPQDLLTQPQRTIHPILITHPPGNQNTIQLTVGLPDRCHRRRPDWVRVAINGRLVQMPELEQVMLGAFRRTLPRDRYPVCFVHLRLSANYIDWNRHPAKSEVYLHHLSYWQEQVAQAIEQVLSLNPSHLSTTLYSERVGNLLKTAEAEGGYAVSREITSPASEVENEPDVSDLTPYAPAATSSLKAVAQVHNTYILAEHATGLWLVEQHIAHERVLYEQLCDRWHLVSLEPPIILSQLSKLQVEQLQRLGIEVEPFGEQLWAVRDAPDLLARREDCAEALLELSLGGDLQAAQVATACRSAIRNGTPLALSEMQSLLNQWQQTRHPRTCPHGRPIYLPLEETSLARFFRRHWVIGKSHGI